VVEEAKGGEYAYARCPDRLHVIGGGCGSMEDTRLVSCSAPHGENTWKCGGKNTGGKHTWAICAKAPLKASSGNETSATNVSVANESADMLEPDEAAEPNSGSAFEKQQLLTMLRVLAMPYVVAALTA